MGCCEECMKLLALYKRSLFFYDQAVEQMSGTVDEEFARALNLVRERYNTSQDAADALTMHQVSHHGIDPPMTRVHRAAAGQTV